MDATNSLQLLDAALQLPVDEREELALALLDSLSTAEEAAAIEEEWRVEIARRVAAFRVGESIGVPWEAARKQMFPS